MELTILGGSVPKCTKPVSISYPHQEDVAEQWDGDKVRQSIRTHTHENARMIPMTWISSKKPGRLENGLEGCKSRSLSLLQIHLESRREWRQDFCEILVKTLKTSHLFLIVVKVNDNIYHLSDFKCDYQQC